MVSIGAFWHNRVNQTHLDRMSILNQGIGTCFNRISQTFTAIMIKDIQSPYLNRGFMGLSDECLNETIKDINPFRKNVGKGYEVLNQLISEVHWFHEKVLKIHSPLLANQTIIGSLGPISDRYGKMENLKLDLVDEIDAASTQLRNIQRNDEYLMGTALIFFVLSLSLLSLQDFNKRESIKNIEREAMNFLKSGKGNVGGLVDQLVDLALNNQGLAVTAQVFRDYHGTVLENLSFKPQHHSAEKISVNSENGIQEEVVNEIETENNLAVYKTSFKEVLLSIQNIQPNESIHAGEVRDVDLNVSYETFEQMINAAINQMATRREAGKKIIISNQIHSEKSIINLFLAGTTFNVNELEFAHGHNTSIVDGIDMNFVILKEMVHESGAQWHLENKVDRNGMITGMSIKFIVLRTPKEKSKLISLTKGKKKDLSLELMN
jgi:hypothetical protein